MSKSDALVKNTFMLSIGNIFSKGIHFVLIVFVSRWLSTEAYGTFDVISTYVTLLLPVLSLSTGEAMFRFSVTAKAKEEKSAYITNGFFLVICNLTICMVAIGILTSIGLLSASLLPVFLFLLMAQLLNYYLQAFLRAIKMLKLYTLSNIAFTVIVVLLSAVLVHLCGYGLAGLICAYAASYMAANMLIVCTTKLWNYISTATISKNVIKQMIRYSLPLVPNDVSWWVLNVSDRQIILMALGATFNGIYAIANKIPSLCTSVFGVFGVSWQQNIVEQMEQGEWGKYANQVYNQMTVVLLTLCSGILSGTFIFYSYMFDAKYASGMVYTPILLTAIIFSSGMQFFGGIQIALKKTAENGITTVVGAIVNLAIDLALIRFIGLYAAAVSTFVANLVAALLRQYRLRKIVRFRIEARTFWCVVLYGYFVMSFYLLKNNVILEWMNLLLAGIIFAAINYRAVRAFLKR